MPIHGEPNDPCRARFDEAVLALLSDNLTIDSCQESALHWLGHWPHYYRAQVRKIIDGYLAGLPEDAALRA